MSNFFCSSRKLLKSFKNKYIVIIGGSTGIGRALAIDMASYGANVTITARNKEALNKTFLELKNAGDSSSKHNAISADCTKLSEVEKSFNIITKEYPKIDLIIFAAGIGTLSNIEEFKLSEASNIIQTNLIGFLNNLEFILPLLIKQQFGHLAVIASIAGYRGLPDSIAYGPSKAALINLTESLYMDLKKHNINITLINPGFVRTKITDQIKFSMPFLINPEEFSKYAIKKLAKKKWLIQYPRLFTCFVKSLQFIPFKLYNVMVLYSYNRSKSKINSK